MPIKCLLMLCLLGAVPAAFALDKSDAGVFTLLDARSRPTKMQMRYHFAGGQWHSDSRVTANGAWMKLCKQSASCRLRQAKSAETRRWQQVLPAKRRDARLDCIRNSAFAFCRAGTPRERAYWWIALRPNIRALPLQRLH